jgi:hypothetical protein
MGPEAIDVAKLKMDDESEDEARERVMKRFERIGLQIMNRTTSGGPMAQDPIAGVLGDPYKRATAAQILGQAYVKAHNLMVQNKKGVEQIAETLIERKELYGNELVGLLEGAKLKEPRIDLRKESAWPTI